jgi:hypothetical protein
MAWSWVDKRAQRWPWRVGSCGLTRFHLFCVLVAHGKNARSRVPQLYGGVCWFFDEVEKPTNPTRMGSMREPGSLTLPQGTPAEGRVALTEFPLPFIYYSPSCPPVPTAPRRLPLLEYAV